MYFQVIISAKKKIKAEEGTRKWKDAFFPKIEESEKPFLWWQVVFE